MGDGPRTVGEFLVCWEMDKREGWGIYRNEGEWGSLCYQKCVVEAGMSERFADYVILFELYCPQATHARDLLIQERMC